MHVLVVGTLAFDSVETPFGVREATLGGSASFLATAGAYFTPIRMLGVVGEDFPQAHMDFFKSRSVDVSGVRVLPGKTFAWKGRYDHNLNNAQTVSTDLNVLTSFDPVLPESYLDSEYVVLGNIDPVLQERVLLQLRNPRWVVCDTMNYWIKDHLSALKKTLRKVDLLTINDGEARMLSGEYNLIKAAQAVFAMGPKMLVVKRGEYGALLFTRESVFAAPAFPLEEVFDPTGAGDSFAGGLVGYVASQGRIDETTLRRGVVMGSTMASFAVENFSLDRFRNLSKNDIDARYAEFERLMRF